MSLTRSLQIASARRSAADYARDRRLLGYGPGLRDAHDEAATAQQAAADAHANANTRLKKDGSEAMIMGTNSFQVQRSAGNEVMSISDTGGHGSRWNYLSFYGTGGRRGWMGMSTNNKFEIGNDHGGRVRSNTTHEAPDFITDGGVTLTGANTNAVNANNNANNRIYNGSETVSATHINNALNNPSSNVYGLRTLSSGSGRMASSSAANGNWHYHRTTYGYYYYDTWYTANSESGY